MGKKSFYCLNDGLPHPQWEREDQPTFIWAVQDDVSILFFLVAVEALDADVL